MASGENRYANPYQALNSLIHVGHFLFAQAIGIHHQYRVTFRCHP